ncbi:hypothetical protein IMZ31_19400 (plasmid) [Pontibacillus sp. ALD_SL1]|uniref:hypothetical protein n=1 Tax=Pontibacillus sp. ALD_SL1 TaxID=2777185 RepID=UPI001A96B299|nr:hypothetical protein [Pontibacillus sp. ALD_SL1]QST02717.1 hypothetical protein IMZ31_19400 [Pontibacillus sp. ALD_SL1]
MEAKEFKESDDFRWASFSVKLREEVIRMVDERRIKTTNELESFCERRIQSFMGKDQSEAILYVYKWTIIHGLIRSLERKNHRLHTVH